MIGLMKKDLYVADKTGRLLLVLAVAVIAGAFLLRWLHYARRRRRYGKRKNL